MQQLIHQLKTQGLLRDPAQEDAFVRIDRADFVPAEMKMHAYEDRPLPIGYGQTISQPRVVAFMLELLQAEKGNRVLDVGSGSGYQSALLSELVGKEGEVTAIERIPELFAFGRENCRLYKQGNIKFILGDGTVPVGPPGYFDRIIAAAASQDGVPASLKQQLKIGGRMVIPVRDSILLVTRPAEDLFRQEEFPGFLFVPLIEDRLRGKD